MSDKIKRASEFARQAHAAVGQRRKYTGEPYIVHPAAVARQVAGVTNDESMICAAWLHDVVEDTPVTLDEIAQQFGDEVARLVGELTRVSRSGEGTRSARKRLDLEHTRAASPSAKTIKLADLIDNLTSIADHDPAFARIYMGEKQELLKVLTEGDETLYRRATDIVSNYFNREQTGGSPMAQSTTT